MKSQGLCETTLTERFENLDCKCATYQGNLGPCAAHEKGGNDRCVYCDHDMTCKPKVTKHICHARGCTVEVSEGKFMCLQHWYMLTRDLRRKLTSAHKTGKKPSKAWLDAARQAIMSITPVPVRDDAPTADFASVGWKSENITASHAIINGEVIRLTGGKSSCQK